MAYAWKLFETAKLHPEGEYFLIRSLVAALTPLNKASAVSVEIPTEVFEHIPCIVSPNK